MQNSNIPLSMLEANKSYHMRLNNGLDMFQQEYELRKIEIPKNIISDIATLRDLIQTTVGEDFLYERFKNAVTKMWTWEDVFSYFNSNDLTTKNYMFIVLNSLSKDRIITELKKDKCTLNNSITSIEKQHASKIDLINSLHKEELTAMQKALDANTHDQKKMVLNSQKEIMLLKKQVNSLQERLMSGDSSVVVQLTKQNSEQLTQIALLQKEILNYRNKDRLLQVAEAKQSIRQHPQGQVQGLLNGESSLKSVVDSKESTLTQAI